MQYGRTYKSPVPNTAEMVNFFFNATFSFQTAKTGSKSMEKSLAMLIADVAKMYGFIRLMHDADGIGPDS